MYPADAAATFNTEAFLVKFNGLVVEAEGLRDLPNCVKEGGVAGIKGKGSLVRGQGARILREGLIDL